MNPAISQPWGSSIYALLVAIIALEGGRISKRTNRAMVFSVTFLLIIIYILDTYFCEGAFNYEKSQ